MQRLLSQRQQHPRWPRGPLNDLHKAVERGDTERAVALLSSKKFNVDESGGAMGVTPLMIAIFKGNLRMVKILLDEGCNLSITNDDGAGPLHLSAQGGKLSITRLLVESGAEIEASTWMGATPLHVASDEGHSEVVRALCEAGADVDTRKADRSTPLISAAIRGHANSTRELLRAKANPLLVKPNAVGKNFTPLDAAALHGRAEVARELIKQVGIRGCAGPSGGVDALELAAQGQHVEILAMLTDAGVVDPGIALNVAADCGHEAAVKFLLQAQSHNKRRTTTGQASYVNILDAHGASPLIRSIDVDVDRLCFPRIVRMLIDAGADARSALRITERGTVLFHDTPLAFTNRTIRENKVAGKPATKMQLQRLEATRRVLLRVEAIHSASWLWIRDVPSKNTPKVENAPRTPRDASRTPLPLMVPLIRRRAVARRVLFASLWRHSAKP
ncbi:unnamed protein product [Ectocarpus sp. 13 AM-2016]